MKRRINGREGYLKMNMGRRIKKNLFACLLFILFASVLMLPLLPPSLMASSNGKVLYAEFVDDRHFEVGFRHSINKGYVREIYRIDPKTCRLTLEKGYYQSFGAGMIDTVQDSEGLNFRREGDYYVLDFPPNWQKKIPYIGGNIAGHIFIYDGDEIPFGTLYPRQPFTIFVKRRSILEWIIG